MSDESVAKLWALVGELSDQLTQNRAVTSRLQGQMAEIKEQAVHTNAGFPLRRFNTDLSQEDFTSALEEFSTRLVLENRTVAHENKQLSLLLREYEATLEGVMGKFRSLAHANATHELALHAHYTQALQALAHGQGQASLGESTAINAGLGRVGRLLRSALRVEMGEEGEEDEGGGVRSSDNDGAVSRAGRSTSDISAQGGYLPPPAYSRATAQPPLSNGDGRKASATATTTKSSSKTFSQIGDSPLDWALEREAELCRLEEENASLRQMLRLDRELGPLLVVSEGGGGKVDDDDSDNSHHNGDSVGDEGGEIGREASANSTTTVVAAREVPEAAAEEESVKDVDGDDDDKDLAPAAAVPATESGPRRPSPEAGQQQRLGPVSPPQLLASSSAAAAAAGPAPPSAPTLASPATTSQPLTSPSSTAL